MGNLIKGIHHVALKCTDTAEFEKTIHFYRDVLQLDVARSWGEGADAGIMLETGSGIIEIFASCDSRLEQGAIRHFALETDDTDACIRVVREAGYQVTMEPTDIVIGSVPPYPARVAFAIGPVGEEIEFFDVK